MSKHIRVDGDTEYTAPYMRLEVLDWNTGFASTFTV